MYGSNDWDDGECTAAPGVMGEKACHKYPGCGCGQSPSYTKTPAQEREDNLSLLRMFGADSLSRMLPHEDFKQMFSINELIFYDDNLEEEDFYQEYLDDDEPFPF